MPRQTTAELRRRGMLVNHKRVARILSDRIRESKPNVPARQRFELLPTGLDVQSASEQKRSDVPLSR